MTRPSPTVLVADAIAAEGVECMRAGGLKLLLKHDLGEAELARQLRKADGVVVRSATKLTAKVLTARSSVRVIGRAGIGVDNIDVPRASELGIVVVNTPDANAVTTAELAIAHMFSLARRLTAADASVRAGKWERGRFTGTEIAGKIAGIIGFGTIGRIVASRCRALGLKVCVHDPFVDNELISTDGYAPVTMAALLRQADFLSIHAPGTAQTMGLIGAAELAKMKKGAFVIQCARGGIVDEQALAAALRKGRIAGAAVDVYTAEPVKPDNPLLAAPNIAFTPHLGASTAEAQRATGLAIAKQLVTYFATGEAVNSVNMPRVPANVLSEAAPYAKLARRLGALLGAVMRTSPKLLELTLHGAAADLPDHLLMSEALAGLLGPQLSVPVNMINARSLAERQGIEVHVGKMQAAHDFISLVQLKAHGAKGDHSLAGTLLGGSKPLLVGFEGFELEAPLTGTLLFTVHQDKPGVIAELTGILAARRINITHMHVSSGASGRLAAACLRLEAELDAGMVAKIAQLPAVKKAFCLQP